MKVKLIFIFVLVSIVGHSQLPNKIIVGAEQPEKYMGMLKTKSVAIVVNHTSVINGVYLLDWLLQNKISVNTIFAPEHGFRGEAAAGEVVNSGFDIKTGVKVISIYGKNKKPTKEQLAGIEVIIFDIQDVGCRFYTFISTLHYVIEACAENDIQLIVLDRPNPNGDYVAGAVLRKEFQSFVGVDPIPVVHGCTVGELALMINGEGWAKENRKCDLTVIPVKGYDHSQLYELPIKPSPNLPNSIAVRLYPSLCFFEATSVSIGRGTELPFQVIGFPDKNFGTYSFTPHEIIGIALNPIQEGNICYGENLSAQSHIPKFTLSYFLKYYKKFNCETDFLTRESWLNRLAGSDELIEFIRQGKSENEILQLWQSDLDAYKIIRKKYLLYPDFE